MLISMFRSSRVISFRFDDRTQCGAHVHGQQHGVSTAKLYKFGWNTFPNNARNNYRTDLNLSEVVYISMIFHILVSWLDWLNGYVFFCDGVTLQTSHSTWNRGRRGGSGARLRKVTSVKVSKLGFKTLSQETLFGWREWHWLCTMCLSKWNE